MPKRFAIALHGGAGVISRTTDPLPYEAALNHALTSAELVLERGRHGAEWALHALPEPPLALAAALAAVESMEDCSLFNAGRGAVFNDAGFIENEASVMYGATRRSGAVCGLRTVQNPARLATVVHTASRFQFLGFTSAEAFADRYGTLVARRPPEWFETPRRREQLRRALEQGGHATLDHSGGTVSKGEGEGDDGAKGTVGCAVCDADGNVAVATSTGGLTCKMAGRVGDTPVIGAGSYADNRTLALSGTGIGEQFLRTSAASRVSCAMQYGRMGAADALTQVVHGTEELSKGAGGFVAVTPDGQALASFNSVGMFRALADGSGKRMVRIWED